MSDILIQAVGIIAMFFNIFSYQQKTTRRIIAFQLLGGLLFSINFLLLEAYIGALLNIIATIRAILFLNKEKLKTENNIWFGIFCLAYLSVYCFISYIQKKSNNFKFYC